jgi:AcrR family transcriptional regulator
MEKIDGRRVRGDQSRRAVLQRAVQIASTDGLEGLSIGRLALEVSASKSGVATLFGSKEQLQLATVEAARTIFIEAVIAPARGQARGLARVAALARGWLDYSSSRVFEGGCFFLAAAAEFDSRPGTVRDAVAAIMDERDSYFAHAAAVAVERGELAGCDDAEQLAFEITALLDAANSRSLILGSEQPYARALAAVRSRLLHAGGDEAVLSAAGLSR